MKLKKYKMLIYKVLEKNKLYIHSSYFIYLTVYINFVQMFLYAHLYIEISYTCVYAPILSNICTYQFTTVINFF